MVGGYQLKANSLSTMGSNIVRTSVKSATSTILSDKFQLGLETTIKKASDLRTSRPAFARGIGLTPRLFDALMSADPAPVEALPSAYLATISRHVDCLAPSKNVFAQYWCPVVVEDKAGGRHMLHVDPLVVRKFRRTVAGELEHVREKRNRMIQRTRHIREEFPQMEARDLATRLHREIDDARGHANELLLQPLPEAITTLHVFLEVTPYMLQLSMVCQRLAEELPAVMAAAGVRRVSFSILGSQSSGITSTPDVEALPGIPPFDFSDGAAWSAACDWLSALHSSTPPSTSTEIPQHCGFHFAKALRWATTAEAFAASGKSGVLLVACSKPEDLEACTGMARRSDVLLQIVGIFGLSPVDPEPALQQLADASATGSSFRLFFGSAYWSQFIAARERQLQTIEQSAGESLPGGDAGDGLSGDNEIVSAKVFEMRLIERIMRECYSEEQQCEEELTCATRVFERKLIEREDLLAVLRGGNVGTQTLPPQFAVTPNTARRSVQ